MGILGDIGHLIMTPLYFAISLVLSGFHQVFGAVFGDGSGAAWALSIIGLTATIRAALIPLFVKQIKSSRNMQLIQPQIRELQKKYAHDREKLAQEQMKLFKDTNTNPFAACLPLILQMPIFIALFRLLNVASQQEEGRGVLSDAQAKSLATAKLFGVQISDSFTKASGSTALNVQILAGLLVVAMTATTFLTQRQLMTKNMPSEALTGQYAQQQKLLLYVLPVVFAVGGIAFPIGVLLYWTTSNLWTMGQQFYVIRRNPSPNTPAYAAKLARDAEKHRKTGSPELPPAAGFPATPPVDPTAPGAPGIGGRSQPKRQTRSQRQKKR